ncbi:4789_t:CDS:2 [Dentiscutata erythropus]|uniref:4789_t:CDS:1 n=1 Tax=Dentiscutata erythropus TaxID=1348616 RepID=A0A9N9HNJ2_9GLOM|nr:4789_t:CDS:2 [Dentiscutata erythropus]
MKLNNESFKNQQVSKPYQCILYQIKQFKSLKELYQHEILKHYDYKILLSDIPYLSPNTIQQFCEIKSQFVGVCGPWIQRYLPCKRKYIYSFKGQDTDATMGMILQDNK